jgi:N-acetylmuramic acid 6-phosphate etherase
VDGCAATKGKSFASIPFQSIWVGLAGYDRPRVAEIVNSELVKLFNRPLNDGLKISNDLDLLVTPSASKHDSSSAIVLVVGTGSVAMSYKKDGNQFVRTGRSGGWGHLLGDDGSGYALGREGARLALETADELNLNQVSSNKSMGAVDPLVQKIFMHFDIDSKAGGLVDLLDRLLTSEHGSQQDASTTKKKITGLSRIVLEECASNNKAKAIAQDGSKYLARMLSVLIDNQDIDLSSSTLILAGGLIQNETYKSMILDGLLSSGKRFKHVEIVTGPAANAAEYLVRLGNA